MATAMEKNCFKLLILYLERFDYVGLKELMLNVIVNGVEVKCVLSGNSETLEEATLGLQSDVSYIITDCKDGVDLALLSSVGFCFLENSTTCAVRAVNAECVLLGFEGVDFDFVLKMYQRHFHLPWDIVETARLKLREITVDDVEALYEIYKDKSVTRYMEDLFEDIDEERVYTEEYISNVYEVCGFGLWLVIEKETGKIIGRAGLDLREGYETAELAYMIAADKQRQGFAYEACKAVVDYARNVLEMKSLNCFVAPGNEASIRLCEKLGFRYLSEVCLNEMWMYRYTLTFLQK